MLSSTFLTIIGLFVSVIAIAARFFFWSQGRNRERLKNAEKTLDDIKKGNIAASDPSYDDELRDKYGLK